MFGLAAHRVPVKGRRKCPQQFAGADGGGGAWGAVTPLQAFSALKCFGSLLMARRQEPGFAHCER